MVDWTKDRTGNPAVDRSQDRAKENVERSIPPWVRDGRESGTEDDDTKEVRVTFVAADEKTIVHGLGRVPKGWFTHSHRGDGHAIVEVDKDEDEIVLKNLFAGATTASCVLWIW